MTAQRAKKAPAAHWTTYIRGQRKAPGQMNKTEAAYAELLAARQARGEIIAWWFEPLSLRLADNCRYTPDFGVLLPDGRFELHETKGFWKEAARVRIKVAAETYPFVFIAAKRRGGKLGGWTFENISQPQARPQDG